MEPVRIGSADAAAPYDNTQEPTSVLRWIITLPDVMFVYYTMNNVKLGFCINRMTINIKLEELLEH